MHTNTKQYTVHEPHTQYRKQPVKYLASVQHLQMPNIDCKEKLTPGLLLKQTVHTVRARLTSLKLI